MNDHGAHSPISDHKYDQKSLYPGHPVYLDPPEDYSIDRLGPPSSPDPNDPPNNDSTGNITPLELTVKNPHSFVSHLWTKDTAAQEISKNIMQGDLDSSIFHNDEVEAYHTNSVQRLKQNLAEYDQVDIDFLREQFGYIQLTGTRIVPGREYMSCDKFDIQNHHTAQEVSDNLESFLITFFQICGSQQPSPDSALSQLKLKLGHRPTLVIKHYNDELLSQGNRLSLFRTIRKLVKSYHLHDPKLSMDRLSTLTKPRHASYTDFSNQCLSLGKVVCRNQPDPRTRRTMCQTLATQCLLRNISTSMQNALFFDDRFRQMSGLPKKSYFQLTELLETFSRQENINNPTNNSRFDNYKAQIPEYKDSDESRSFWVKEDQKKKFGSAQHMAANRAAAAHFEDSSDSIVDEFFQHEYLAEQELDADIEYEFSDTTEEFLLDNQQEDDDELSICRVDFKNKTSITTLCQDLGILINSCFRCGSLLHMSKSDLCAYKGQIVTRVKCATCNQGGHVPTRTCLDNKKKIRKENSTFLKSKKSFKPNFSRFFKKPAPVKANTVKLYKLEQLDSWVMDEQTTASQQITVIGDEKIQNHPKTIVDEIDNETMILDFHEDMDDTYY